MAEKQWRAPGAQRSGIWHHLWHRYIVPLGDVVRRALRWRGVILTVIAVLVLLRIFHPGEFGRWIQEGQNQTIYDLASLAAIFFLVAYDACRELALVKAVKVTVVDIRRPMLHGTLNTQRSGEILKDAFSFACRLRLRNDASEERSVKLLEATLFRRSSGWRTRWEAVELRRSIGGWTVGDRFELPKRTEREAFISVLAAFPEDAAFFLGASFKLRVRIDILGQLPYQHDIIVPVVARRE